MIILSPQINAGRLIAASNFPSLLFSVAMLMAVTNWGFLVIFVVLMSCLKLVCSSLCNFYFFLLLLRLFPFFLTVSERVLKRYVNSI